MRTAAWRRPGLARFEALCAVVLPVLTVLALLPGSAAAQAGVNTAPSRQTLEEAARDGCDGVSVVVARCAGKTDDVPAGQGNDPLTRSRAAAKAAFDRRERAARGAALDGSRATTSGDAERLGPVTVTGRTTEDQGVEQVLQRALNPNTEGTLSPDGKTISHSGLNGSRFDCVAKCVGPMCCVEVRAMPNPARESNSIGR